MTETLTALPVCPSCGQAPVVHSAAWPMVRCPNAVGGDTPAPDSTSPCIWMWAVVMPGESVAKRWQQQIDGHYRRALEKA